MFTPPPSPSPPRVLRSSPLATPEPDSDSDSVAPLKHPPASNVTEHDAKQRTARRTKWSIILIPAVLVFIALSTRYLSHPALLDALSPESPEAISWRTLADWHTHPKREPQAASIAFPTPTASSAPSSPSPSPTPSSSGNDNTTPTIPMSPPVLPTPFPQALDTTLSRNFSTQGCQNFFTNMTQSDAFRSCRPFSLLQGTSSAFIQVQTNLTALNAIIWGTCNTDISLDQCTSNIAWFASTMQSVCSAEIQAQNSMVEEVLTGLQTYSLLRSTACLPNPSTSTYCYISAAALALPSSPSPNLSDIYLYQLPLGIGLPPSVTPSCTPCAKAVLGAYAQALSGNATAGAGEDEVAGLVRTYGAAAELVNGQCGAGYAQVLNGVSAGSRSRAGAVRAEMGVVGVVAAAALVGVGLW